MIKAKRIIVDSIKDQLIPQVSSKNTPKDIFYVLTIMYEDNLYEYELMMTTLNGLTRPWDAFIQTICARKDKLQFDSLWEECVQEEARVANREVILLKDEDQAISCHAKGGKGKSHFQKETHFHK
jgi:hypothetical protein